MTIIDISRKLEIGMPSWPGDTPFSYEVSWSKEESGSVNVGKLIMSIHMGTHIDAPFHFDNDGKRTFDLDLNVYIGPAYVADLSGKEKITRKDLESLPIDGVKRLLIKTSSWENDTVFPESITYLDADVGQFLSEKGIVLIGVDVPSVDPLDSKELSAHHSLHSNGVHILEAVNLEHVNEGIYELIALPLAIVEGDGSPVRAILRSI
jgi:arylformamidase